MVQSKSDLRVIKTRKSIMQAFIKLSDENENVFAGNVVAANTKNCIIEAKDKLIAAVGLDNIVVVDTEDVTLIGDKVHMGEIKQILSMLRERGDGGRYL